MITKPGAVLTVDCYADDDRRKEGTTFVTEKVHSVSAGPPGVVADWGRTDTGRWVLIRNPMPGRTAKWEGTYQ